jgi:maltokinase
VTHAPLTSSMPQLLGPWLAGQRWYAAKGTDPRDLERAGGLRLVDDDGTVGVEVHFVVVTGPDGARVTYQVPLTYHASERPELTHALIGRFEHPDLGVRWIYDGPHDPVFVRALLRLLDGGRAAGDGAGPEAGLAVGVKQRPGAPPSGPTRVLRGEQSNTSIIIDAHGADPAIVKLFRVLAGGSNPDVVVQTRLAAAGCERVPHPVGWIEGTWASGSAGPAGAAGPSGSAGESVQGHLAYACEFIGDGQDAWRVACAAVEHGEPFDEQARELGAATAEVHTALAAAMPTRPVDAATLERLAEGLAGRIEWAVGLAPALEAFAPAARDAVRALRDLDGLPDLQQVHGDYHLGQVLRSPSRGWIVLDFEGEPLRPLAERLDPDVALRDVAGMLRSFDYAARHATVSLPPTHPSTLAADRWSQQCRAAFLEGYAAAGGHAGAGSPAEAALLRALEIDKALYEVVYETLNRPAWVSIPMTALERLTAPAR